MYFTHLTEANMDDLRIRIEKLEETVGDLDTRLKEIEYLLNMQHKKNEIDYIKEQLQNIKWDIKGIEKNMP